ncbi:hypothetical protein BGX38DRAFT_1274621 [Terfezia claveryi]|nr:hypothetical protein BGX38DRAFT_1274621 [Terfezia claveryi]
MHCDVAHTPGTQHQCWAVALASGTHWDFATALGTHWNVAPSPGTQHQCWAVALASGMHWDVAPVPGTQAYMQPLSRRTWWVNTTRLQLASATFLHQPAM